MLRCDGIGDLARFRFVADENQAAKRPQTLNCQFAARKLGDLLREFNGSGLKDLFTPRNKDTRTWSVFGCANMSAAVNSGRVDSSAITTTSLGPAIESISTSP